MSRCRTRWTPLLSATLLALVLAGCQARDARVARPTDPPGAQIGQKVPLVARLTVTPPMLQAPPGPGPAPAVPAQLRLTFTVTNPTDRVYQGESPDGAVARFALVLSGEPIWSAPQFATQAVTPVSIPPGGTVTYEAVASIPDVRVLRGRLLEARASFSPAELQATTIVPVN